MNGEIDTSPDWTETREYGAELVYQADCQLASWGLVVACLVLSVTCWAALLVAWLI